MNYIIIANGPFIPSQLIREIMSEKIMIALDGAIQKLEKIHIQPTILLGDFDSIEIANHKKWGIIENQHESYVGNFNIQIVPANNQSKTDLEKAIDYCDLHHAKTIDIICATDGRMDHTLGNLRLLKKVYRPNRPLHMHTATETIFYVENTTIEITGHVGSYCGIAAFPKACFSSTGLLFNGQNTELAFGMCDSFNNQLAEEKACIEIRGQALIIAPGQFPSQKIFQTMSFEKINQIAAKEQD